MKPSEVTVERLRALGYSGYAVRQSKGGPFMETVKDDEVLQAIVNAAHEGRELVFEKSIYWGHVTVHEKDKVLEYARRKMNKEELADAEEKFARMGLKPRWK